MLHVAYGTVVWGAEQTILRLAPLLDERGIDVALAAPAGGALEPAWRALGFPFVPIDVLERPGLRRSDGSGRRPSATTLARESTTIARSAARMAAVVGRTKSDLLHSHALQGHLELAIVARLRGRSAVLHQHDLVLPGMGRRVLGVATSVAGEMIAISDAVAECVPGRARARVDVVHHGIDLERFRPGPVDPGVRDALGGADALVVGILGRVDPSKGVDRVVRAMSMLNGANGTARLAVVGAAHLASDDYIRELRREGDRLLGDRLRFVGPRDDVPEVLRAVDVLVNASEAEPFGLTLIEAQACGIPVIAMRSGGAPEVVVDGVTGVVVPPDDDRALATAIDRILGDDDGRRAMGAAARRHAEADHDIRAQADRIVEIYRRRTRRPNPAWNSSAAPR